MGVTEAYVTAGVSTYGIVSVAAVTFSLGIGIDEDRAMMDARRLRQITPSKRGWRFVGKWRGCRGFPARELKANVPYLVITTAAMTRHYTRMGAEKRLRILATCKVPAVGVVWLESGQWATIAGWAKVSGY